MKLIIAGSRDLPRDEDQAIEMGLILMKFQLKWAGEPIEEVVSGGAGGADSAGENWAKLWKIPVKRFPADWKKWGKIAGIMRNCEMARYANACVVFWDGRSPGSKDMIHQAMRNSLKLFVFTL